MSDTIVITLCLAGLWVLLLGLLLFEMRSDSWIGVAWRNADVTSQVSKNVRAVCIRLSSACATWFSTSKRPLPGVPPTGRSSA